MEIDITYLFKSDLPAVRIYLKAHVRRWEGGLVLTQEKNVTCPLEPVRIL